MPNVKVPSNALCLVDRKNDGACVFSKENEEDKPKLKMTAYSGQIIPDHWYWDDLVLDVAGMKAPKGKFPILEDHDTGKKIAFTKDPIIENFQVIIDSDKTTFVDTPFSSEFIKLSTDGFPYQSSVRAVPTKIQRLAEKEEAEVNGFKMKGPGTIFREWSLMESSVTVFGYDSHTSSSAFSKEEVELSIEDITKVETKEEDTNLNLEETQTMDYEKLCKEHPEIVAQIQAETTAKVTEELSKKFASDKSELETTFSTQISSLRDEVTILQKENTISRAKNIEKDAHDIWVAKLGKSEIPEYMHDKVMAMVQYGKFTKDFILDSEGFSAAIDAEIKDWEDRGVCCSSVLGSGTASDKESNSKEARLEKESDDLANKMFSFVKGKNKKGGE